MTFTWLSAALEGPAQQLRNCVLVVSLAGFGSKECALRRPQTMQEFIVGLDRSVEQQVIELAGSPPIDSMQLELLEEPSGLRAIEADRRATRREDLIVTVRNQPPNVQLRLR